MEVDSWLHQLKNGKVLTEREVKLLCLKVQEIFCEVKITYLRNRTFSQFQPL